MCGVFASLVKGDSPQCVEMWRSDRGDGHRFGEGPPQVVEGLRLYIPVGADTIRPLCAYSHGKRLLCYGCLSVTTCRVRCPHRTVFH